MKILEKYLRKLRKEIMTMDDVMGNNLNKKELKSFNAAVKNNDVNEIKHWTKVAKSREVRNQIK